jgi:hypothetical protein
MLAPVAAVAAGSGSFALIFLPAAADEPGGDGAELCASFRQCSENLRQYFGRSDAPGAATCRTCPRCRNLACDAIHPAAGKHPVTMCCQVRVSGGEILMQERFDR